MMNLKNNIAEAISNAKYDIHLRMSDLEVALEQLKKEEETIIAMSEDYERYEVEFTSAKEVSIAADAEVKRLEDAKLLLGADFTEELGKKLKSAKAAATRAMNKASKLGEELLQLEARILALNPTKEEPKKEAETNPVSTPVTPAVKKEYPTKMKMKTNKVFTKEDGTKLVFFKKYEGSFVKYDAAIRDAASVLLPEKEYDVEGHWSSDRWTFYVDRVVDNGSQVMPVVASVPDVDEATTETHGTYNAMAEAFAKANAKKMA